MTTFLDDADVIDQSAIERNLPLYVMAQWLNGDPKLAPLGKGNVAYAGGAFIPNKYLRDDLKPADGWGQAQVTFSSGETDQGHASTAPKLAVIRTRFCWFVKKGKNTDYFPRAAYVADSGMRGKVQALCGVAGYEFPVVITFTGKASQEFERGLKDFGTRLDSALNKLGKQFPRFAFYMPLGAGPHVKAGQNGQESIVTPPVVTVQGDLTREWLNSVYVGRDRLTELQAQYHRAAEWAAAWDKGQPAAVPDAEAPAPDDYAADDPGMTPVAAPTGQPYQTAAQALGFDPGSGPVKQRRPNSYSEGR